MSIEKGLKTIDIVSQRTDSAIVFCSFGKDSLAVIDMVYPKFKRVVVVFMYFVPNLEHIDRWVRWAKNKYPRIEMLQIPHWTLSYILKTGMFCVPNPNIKLVKLTDVIKAVRINTGIEYVFLGMKKADGMNRRLMLNTYQKDDYIHESCVYPVAEFNKKEILSYLKSHGIPEPIGYGKKASNGLGFNIDCYLWMRENYPNDLKKVLRAFPLSEKLLFDYDNREKS